MYTKCLACDNRDQCVFANENYREVEQNMWYKCTNGDGKASSQ